MKADPILEEVWRVKDKLSREMAADPDAYFSKLDKITNAQERAGRKIIRSAEELRQLVAEKESQRPLASPMALNDKPSGGMASFLAEGKHENVPLPHWRCRSYSRSFGRRMTEDFARRLPS